MTRARRGTFLAVVAAFAVVAASVLAARVAPAADAPAGSPPAPAPAPAPVPAPLPSPPPTASPAPKDPTAKRTGEIETTEDLEALLKRRTGPFIAGIVLRIVASLAGAVLLILVLARQRDVRRGLAPPLRASSPPATSLSVVVALFLWIVVWASAGLLVLGYVLATGGDLKHAHVPDLVGFAIQAAVSAPVALVAYRAVLRGRQAEARAPWPRAAAVRVGLGGWLVGTAFAFAGALVAAFVLHELGYDPKPQDLVRRAVSPNATPGFLAALAVYGSVIAPVVEECVFRGAIFASLRRVRFLGPVGAGVVSAAIFGAVHMDVTAFLPLFGLALVLAWVYERTGSLVAPIAVHMLNNASSLLPIVLLHT